MYDRPYQYSEQLCSRRRPAMMSSAAFLAALTALPRQSKVDDVAGSCASDQLLQAHLSRMRSVEAESIEKFGGPNSAAPIPISSRKPKVPACAFYGHRRCCDVQAQAHSPTETPPLTPSCDQSSVSGQMTPFSSSGLSTPVSDPRVTPAASQASSSSHSPHEPVWLNKALRGQEAALVRYGTPYVALANFPASTTPLCFAAVPSPDRLNLRQNTAPPKVLPPRLLLEGFGKDDDSSETLSIDTISQQYPRSLKKRNSQKDLTIAPKNTKSENLRKNASGSDMSETDDDTPQKRSPQVQAVQRLPSTSNKALPSRPALSPIHAPYARPAQASATATRPSLATYVDSKISAAPQEASAQASTSYSQPFGYSFQSTAQPSASSSATRLQAAQKATAAQTPTVAQQYASASRSVSAPTLNTSPQASTSQRVKYQAIQTGFESDSDRHISSAPLRRQKSTKIIQGRSEPADLTALLRSSIVSTKPTPLPRKGDLIDIVYDEQILRIPADTSTTARDVLLQLEADHTISSTSGWSLWERVKDEGLERPIRQIETLQRIRKSWAVNWKDVPHGAFVLKRAECLVASDESGRAPPVNRVGMVKFQTKHKWVTRYLELKTDPFGVCTLWLSKGDKQDKFEMLANMSQVDAYTLTKKHTVPTNAPFAFAVKSGQPKKLFENSSDYISVFAVDKTVGAQWLTAIREAKSFMLRRGIHSFEPANRHPGLSPPTSSTPKLGFSFESGSLLARLK